MTERVGRTSEPLPASGLMRTAWSGATSRMAPPVTSKRVVICGGRDLRGDSRWHNMLSEYDEMYGPFSHVIHGGATGGDNIGREWAALHNLPVTEYRANWKRFGKRAGPLRNQRMLDEGRPDLVIALPGGRGTEDMIARAKAAGVPVIDVERNPWP